MNEVPGRSGGAAWRRVEMAGGAGGALILDETTGLPSAIEFPSVTRLAPIVCTTSLVLRVGGDEVRALAGGLDYPGAEELSGFSVAAGGCSPGREEVPKRGGYGPSCPDGRCCSTTALAASCPEFGWHLSSPAPPAERAPRSQRRTGAGVRSRPRRVAGCTPPGTGWRQGPASLTSTPNSPSPPPPAVSVRSALSRLATAASPHASSCGHSRDSEIGWITLVPETGGVRLRLKTNLAGDPAPGEPLRYTGINFDALDQGWDEVRGRIRPALRSLGVRSPGPKPDWARSAAIYEVQVGRSVFFGRLVVRALPPPGRRDRRPRADRRARLRHGPANAAPALPELQRARLQRHRHDLRRRGSVGGAGPAGARAWACAWSSTWCCMGC